MRAHEDCVAEQGSVLALLNRARGLEHERHKPDGYNIGVTIGSAAGQSRMHVHVHLIPGYACLLAGKV